MINKKTVIFVLIFCLCFQLMTVGMLAASTSDAKEPIDPQKECSLTISYCYGQTAFSNLQVKLYKVADVSADFTYSLTTPFKPSSLGVNGIKTAGEWNVVRSTLGALIVAYDIGPNATLSTDNEGKVCFDDLGAGLYFAVADQIIQDDLHCVFEPVLVSLPGLDDDGYWQYEVLVNAKPDTLPPIDSDEKIELKVLKLWKGDHSSVRPQSVEVEIFCNGESYKSVVLLEENHWSYSWTVNDNGSSWTVVERNVPNGYYMTVEQKECSFVLTNTKIDINDPPDTPQTGDSANVMLYVLLMSVTATALIAIGVARKRIDQ